MFEMTHDTMHEKGGFESVYGDFIPRLRDVRRVPARYQKILPLSVVKRYQCVVLGASSHTLTVGIVGRRDERLFAFLRLLTDAALFPVLVEPGRMTLLIARMERDQRFQQRYSHAYSVLFLPSQVRLLLLYAERRGKGE